MATEPTLIKPRDLPAAPQVFPSDEMIVDNGDTVQKGTPVQIVNAGAPASTEAQALAGTDNATRMTPLRVRQALEASSPFSVQNLADLMARQSLVQGATYFAKNGGAWEVVAPGSGDFDQPITGHGLRVVASLPIWRSSLFPSAAVYASTVRARAAELVAAVTILQVKKGEIVAVPVNPTTQSLFDYAHYVAAGHLVQAGGVLKLEVASGLYNVTGLIDIDNGSNVIIDAASQAAVLDIASITYTDMGLGVWRATINTTSAIPDIIQTGVGAVVGVQNPVGNGTPDAAAQGFVVENRISDTTISCLFRPHGVTALVDMTTPTAGTSMGMAQNKLVVPLTQIRANSAGWTPGGVGFQEGFINSRENSHVRLYNIGFCYNGVNDGHEMVFAQEAFIGIVGGCVFAGPCSIMLRNAYAGRIETRGAFIGMGTGGGAAWQGVADGSFNAIRTMLGGGATEGAGATAGSKAFLTQSVVTCSAIGLRTTYSDSSITVANCRIRHCSNASQPSKGVIDFDSNSSIEYCTTTFPVTGSNVGRVTGNPSLANNTNAPVTPNAIQANGGVWLNGSGRPFDPTFYKVGTAAATLDFPSIAAGGYADLTIPVTGAAFGHMVLVERATSTMPAQGILYDAFVSAPDTVTVRCINHTSSAIDPTAASIRVAVIAVQ